MIMYSLLTCSESNDQHVHHFHAQNDAAAVRFARMALRKWWYYNADVEPWVAQLSAPYVGSDVYVFDASKIARLAR